MQRKDRSQYSLVAAEILQNTWSERSIVFTPVDSHYPFVHSRDLSEASPRFLEVQQQDDPALESAIE
jgi:hypothetical protein